MLEFITWYISLTLLGWLSFPLAFAALRKLPSRGYALSKAVGLLLWGVIFWLLTSLKLLQNDLAGQLTALSFLIAINLWLGWQDKFAGLLAWIKQNRKLILFTEGLFLLTFALWSMVRAANPAIIGTEKPMEMAFITSILRSPTFPPNDPWLSGYGISYYYFGYVMIAMLIRITGVSAGVGYNLSAALWFALTALGAYGVLFDLVKLRWMRKRKDETSATPGWLYWAALTAPLLLLVVSNWHGLLDILHARGLFWSQGADGLLTSAFWERVNLNELTKPPSGPLSWLPTRPGGVQWWGASRVLQDFRLNMESVEVIDEFPFFSYLLSDLHPHVLAMPFVLLIISQALNVYLGGLEGKLRIAKLNLPLDWLPLSLSIISVGGLAFLNTWDAPFYLALVAAAYMLWRYQRQGWSNKRLVEFALLMGGIGVPAIVLYLPFFLSFASQAGGILPSLMFYTRGVYFWVMFGPLLVPIIIYLVYEFIRYKKARNFKAAFGLTFGFMALLFVFSWGLSFLATKLPELGGLFRWLQGAGEVSTVQLLWAALRRRLLDPLTWLSLGLIGFLTMSLLLRSRDSEEEAEQDAKPKTNVNPYTLFVLLLVLWGTLLALAPEFIYLRDQFSTRMNTIFKFYFQVWILWSLAGSYGIIVLWRKSGRWGWLVRVLLLAAATLGLIIFGLHVVNNKAAIPFDGIDIQLGSLASDWLMAAIALIFTGLLVGFLLSRKWVWAGRLLITLALGMGLVYPLVSLWTKTGGFRPYGGLTLDGTNYFRQVMPDMMEAVDWLAKAPAGTLVEAVSPTGGSYTTYASVSTFSGLPTVLGWIGHISQWRGGGEEMGSRQADINRLYSTTRWDEAKAIIEMYNIRYIIVGELELRTYALEEAKFRDNLVLVFERTNARIYETWIGN